MLVDEKQYIVINGWMISELRLKGNELLIFAIIYGFSQDGESQFRGSLQYLADWTNSTKQSVIKCLKSLIEKRLIIKREVIVNGIKCCVYQSTKFNDQSTKFNGTGKQSLIDQSTKFNDQSTKFNGTGKQSLPNNIDIYTSNNIADNIDVTAKSENAKSEPTPSRFAKPTLEEVAAYCKERKNGIDPQHFIDYYESNGWKVGRNSMKNWKAAVRTWERNGYGNGGTNGRTETGITDDFLASWGITKV